MTRALYLATLGGRTRAVPRREAYVTAYYPLWLNQLPPGFRRLKKRERPLPGDFSYWSGLHESAAGEKRARGWHLLSEADLGAVERVWRHKGEDSFSAGNWIASSITRRPK